MIFTDYLLLGAFAAALLYTAYRLFLGWLGTPSHEIETQTSDMPNDHTIRPPLAVLGTRNNQAPL